MLNVNNWIVKIYYVSNLGIVEIKYKAKDLRKTMERLDPEMKRLNDLLASTTIGEEERARVESRKEAREELVGGVYHQIAVQFAELHDTPTRMKEKGVLTGVVPWRESRRFFYWRLRRRLLECQLGSQVREAGQGQQLGQPQLQAMMKRWFIEDQGSSHSYLWSHDKEVVAWLTPQVGRLVTLYTMKHSMQLGQYIELGVALSGVLIISPGLYSCACAQYDLTII